MNKNTSLMGYLTDEEIRKMSMSEVDAYLESHPDQAQHFAKVYAASAAKQAKKTILYLCDGAVESCRKTSCYKRGHECRHTTDEAHALNPEPRNLVPDDQGNLWEVD